MDNLEIWNKYAEVPKNAMRDFNNGKFKGTDINTMWRIKCLTEQFGPCGKGWYYIPKRLWTETCKSGDTFAFAEIELYVKYDGEWSMPISGNGGNKLERVTKDGDLSTSDEAYKMAVTDAIGVACRNLGFGANVYWANDKTKYTEFAEQKEIEDTIKENKDTQAEEFKKYEQQDKQSEIVCSQCGEKLTEKVASFSQEKYGKPLCFNCQKANFKQKSFNN